MILAFIYRRLITAVILICLALPSFSQLGIVPDFKIRSYGTSYFFKPTPTDAIGSPYLHDFWFSGFMTLKDDTTKVEAAFLYDAENDLMLFISEQDTLMVTKPMLLDYIDFANMRFVYAMTFDKIGRLPILKGGYYQWMAGDSIRLLLKTFKYVEENRSINNYMGGGGDGRPRYIMTKTLYYQYPGEDATPLRRSKKGLISASGNKSKQARAFIRSNNLSPQRLEDVIAYFEFLNTLDEVQ